MSDFVKKNKKTCQFICAYDLFENCSSAFYEFEETYSWDNNNDVITLIKAEVIKEILEDKQAIWQTAMPDQSNSVQEQIKTVLERLQQIIEKNLVEYKKDPADPTYVGTTYIDLENCFYKITIVPVV